MNNGLSKHEAGERLKQNGYNELPSGKPKGLGRIALEVMKEPMFLLLISCAALYMLLGDYREGSILLSSTLLIIYITFYQYRKTEKALEALRSMASPRATVIRDGIETVIPGREVVCDDLLILNEGNRVPADAEILDALNLWIDESLLTGESLPVLKTENNAAFSGTLIVQGKGLARVTAIGTQTRFGKIGSALQHIEQDQTHLQKELKQLIRNLFGIGFLICAGVVVAFYLTRGNFIASLLNGLASAIAILPEEFPVVLTVFLALGAWRLSKKKVLTRKPSAIETLGSATVLCNDKTGTITQNKMEIVALYNGKDVYPKHHFSSNKAILSDLTTAAWRASQRNPIDPMEKAIDTAYFTMQETTDVDYTLIKEYPLSRELFAMTRVVEGTNGESTSVSAKGAPEAIFSLCRLQAEEIERHTAVVHQLAEQGYRVIAVAKAPLKHETLPETQHAFDFIFLGLIGLEDPVRAEVPQAVKECYEAGIRVIMITGDFPTTAKSIARQIGIEIKSEVITGDALNNMSDEELKQKINHISIFARVVPEQKLRIVQALKANHEIVAMTGDGVNDAPALKAAHIGIAMGNKGTDVAREAASLVLLDDNFASIVSAIRLGRRIFDNLQKAMSYILAIHIPIVGLALLPAFMPTLPLLLLPLHIVFMELIIDPVCSIAFESEEEEKGVMQRAPRNPDEPFFGKEKISWSIVQGLLLFAMVMGVYGVTKSEGHTDAEVRAIVFSALIIGNVFLILNNLSRSRSFISVILEKNIAALGILGLALILLFLIITVPYLQSVFSFQFPGFTHFLIAFAGAGLLLVVLEGIKYVRWVSGRKRG